MRRLPFLLTSLSCIVLGLTARWAALGSGLWADDFIQHAMLESVYPSQRATWDLFHFVDGSAADRQRMIDYGVDPWWTHTKFRLSLLRPLPSLLRALDHWAFGTQGFPQHVHSMIWWVLLVLAATALLFSVLPPLPAALASVFFSVDESHTIPVLWLSNRSALVATAFSLTALTFHVRWREHQRGASRITSVLLFVVAMSCGEYTFASLAYFLTFELFQQAQHDVSRTRALAPFAAIGVTFVVVSALAGYGSAHSALYTNPFSSPLDYARKLATGLPALVGDLSLTVPADWCSFGSPWPLQIKEALAIRHSSWEKLPSWGFWQCCLGCAGATVTFFLYRYLGARTLAAQHRTVGWLLAGALLGLLPVLGSFVTTRLVMPASLGFAALFGSVLAETCRQLHARRNPIAHTSLLLAVLYLHGARALAQTRDTTNFYSLMTRSRTRWPLTALIDPTRAAGQRVVMIAAADANDAPHLPFVRFAFGQPLVRGFRLLSGAPGAHEIWRIDERTLEVTVLDDCSLAGTVSGSLTRGEHDPVSPGDTFHVAGMSVTVIEARSGQPTKTRFSFDVPLEDDSLVFVHSTSRGLERLPLPEPGTSLALEPPVMPDLTRLVGHANLASQSDAPR